MTFWADLRILCDAIVDRSIADLCSEPARAEDFSVTLDTPSTGAMLFDYAKTSLDAPIRAALIDLAREAGLESRRDAMFSGARINETEDRAVLHTCLLYTSPRPRD